MRRSHATEISTKNSLPAAANTSSGPALNTNSASLFSLYTNSSTSHFSGRLTASPPIASVNVSTPTVTSLITTTLSANGTSQIWSQALTTPVRTTKTATSTCTSTGPKGLPTLSLCSVIILPPGIVWIRGGKPIDIESLLPACDSPPDTFGGLLLSFLKAVNLDICGSEESTGPPGSNDDPTGSNNDPVNSQGNDPEKPNSSMNDNSEEISADGLSHLSTRTRGAVSATAIFSKTSLFSTATTSMSFERLSSTFPSRTTGSSSSVASTTRYLLIPSLDVSEAQKGEFYAANLAGRQGITTNNLSDGTVDSWAVPLSDKNDTSISLLMQRFGYFLPETISIDDGDNVGSNSIQSDSTQAEPIKRSHLETGRVSHGMRSPPKLDSRQTPSVWVARQKLWDLAIISQPRGHQVLAWELGRLYTYVRRNALPSSQNAVQPGQGVRIWILDSGIDLTHPEFASRARVRGSTNPNDYNIQWLFADHDPREYFFDGNGNRVMLTTSWQKPFNTNGPRNPRTGILEAYSDVNGHGTAVSSLIFGDNLGNAPAAEITMVKVVVYTNGPNVGQISLFSLRSGLRKILADIQTRKSQGETKFVLNLSLEAKPNAFTTEAQKREYQAMFVEYMQRFQALDVSVHASSGNNAQGSNSVRNP